ncbi:hypothetical protein [Modestobacter altitudinis]|uniref:hypothetical protein n=1 Tax=Modestobacter altitudinis TaxID=2213158 RepID=UPI00110CC40F|nr:hypothetical protein [Modestobacter altitudinis]
MCKNGGYVNYKDPATGKPFANQGRCVSTLARGGALVPVVPPVEVYTPQLVAVPHSAFTEEWLATWPGTWGLSYRLEGAKPSGIVTLTYELPGVSQPQSQTFAVKEDGTTDAYTLTNDCGAQATAITAVEGDHYRPPTGLFEPVRVELANPLPGCESPAVPLTPLIEVAASEGYGTGRNRVYTVQLQASGFRPNTETSVRKVNSSTGYGDVISSFFTTDAQGGYTGASIMGLCSTPYPVYGVDEFGNRSPAIDLSDNEFCRTTV